jgi:hypothetical protein
MIRGNNAHVGGREERSQMKQCFLFVHIQCVGG